MTFKTEKKYETYIFFETNEFKKPTLLLFFMKQKT